MRSLGVRLGETRDPTRLIPGNPFALRNDADHLDDISATLVLISDSLTAADLGGWTGDAATAFRESIEGTRQHLLVAATALTAASTALRGHATNLEYAQGQAASAIRLFDIVDPVCTAPTLYGPVLSAEQQRAQVLLADARALVHRSAMSAADALDRAVVDAPIVPTFWNQVGYQWSELWGGATESVGGLIGMAWDQNLARFIWDPEGAWGAKTELIRGLFEAVQDPEQLFKDAIDYETWTTSPARAIGHLAPDAIVAALTAGGGVVATRGSSAAARTTVAAVRTADNVADAAAAAARASLELQRVRGYTLLELARTTVGDGPVVFRARANLTAAEIQTLTDHVNLSNAARLDGYLSETGRVSTAGNLRVDADLAAAAERTRAALDGNPYTGHVGHVPDTTWTGKPDAYAWLDETARLNGSLGGQVGRYPVGYRPTIFQTQLPDGTIWPEAIPGDPP